MCNTGMMTSHRCAAAREEAGSAWIWVARSGVSFRRTTPHPIPTHLTQHQRTQLWDKPLEQRTEQDGFSFDLQGVNKHCLASLTPWRNRNRTEVRGHSVTLTVQPASLPQMSLMQHIYFAVWQRCTVHVHHQQFQSPESSSFLPSLNPGKEGQLSPSPTSTAKKWAWESPETHRHLQGDPAITNINPIGFLRDIPAFSEGQTNVLGHSRQGCDSLNFF